MSPENNRNYLLMSLVLQVHHILLTEQTDEEGILQGVCSKLTSHWPYRVVWAGYAETDGSIKVMAAEGETSSFPFEMDLRWDGVEGGDNPMATCIRRRAPVHVNGKSAIGAYGNARMDSAVKAQISSMLIQPLFVDDQCIGGLCVCSELDSSFISDVERTLLALAAQHLGFALSMRRELTFAKIQNQAKLSEMLLDDTQEGILVIDVQGTIIAANPALTRITGYTEQELIGNTPRIFESGFQDKHFYTAMWRSILATGRWRGEVWNKRKNGDIYPDILDISAVRDEQQRVRNYIGVLTDISRQKRMGDQQRSATINCIANNN